MIAKQYSVQLPADYDMDIIRRRVAAAAPRFDAFPGLTWKAFLIRERGRNGALANEYAPFYIWPDTDALWGFAAGDGFGGIVASFGWRPIRTWLPWHVATRPDLRSHTAKTATREEVPIAPTEDLAGLRQAEAAANAASLAADTRLLARVVAVDLERWTLLRFALWSSVSSDLSSVAGPDVFDVLHVSAPGLAG